MFDRSFATTFLNTTRFLQDTILNIDTDPLFVFIGYDKVVDPIEYSSRGILGITHPLSHSIMATAVRCHGMERSVRCGAPKMTEVKHSSEQ